jgi:hypothetical protein
MIFFFLPKKNEEMCAKLLLFISKQHTFSSRAIIRCDEADKQVIQESCTSFQVFIPQINSCAKNASAGFHSGVYEVLDLVGCYVA